MGLDLDYDPKTYCDDIQDIKIEDKPVKLLACLIAEIIELFTPFVMIIKTNIEILTELILSNKLLIETGIILVPSIPLVFLINYFTDTLN